MHCACIYRTQFLRILEAIFGTSEVPPMHPRGRCGMSLSAGCLVSAILRIFVLHVHKMLLLIIINTLAPRQKNMLKEYGKTRHCTCQRLLLARDLHFMSAIDSLAPNQKNVLKEYGKKRCCTCQSLLLTRHLHFMSAIDSLA